MRSLRWIAVVSLASALGSCRCGAPGEPGASDGEAARPGDGGAFDASVVACPPRPDWASPVPDEGQLVAEVLYLLDPKSGRKGTGIRLYDDGRMTAFDEVIFTVSDAGKLLREAVPGEWRPQGTATADAVARVRADIDRPAGTLLDGWLRLDQARKEPPTLVTVRRLGELRRSCYRGADAPPAQADIEDRLKGALRTVTPPEPVRPADAAAKSDASGRP